MPISQKRIGEFLYESLVFLASAESRRRDEIIAHLEDTIHPTAEEAQVGSRGTPDWVTRWLWSTVGPVKAGWVTKDGFGIWAATDEGRAALEQHSDPSSLLAAANDAYKAWEASARRPQRRAWLVRGSSVLGVNLIPEWLQAGYCSLAGSQLRPIEPDIDADELRTIALEDYAHLKHHELKSKVEEIVAFITKMSAGDVVVTTSEHHVYVGDLTLSTTPSCRRHSRRACKPEASCSTLPPT
ncbi:MAG: winged helix-turn-helix domain-containing protein [Actinobacteria bacterium]|nr:winged helix-turn-helix domain-containing protein [Actinomycetota bacterium]